MAAGAGLAALILRDPGDVSNPKASFAPTTKAQIPPEPIDTAWPVYGYDDARTKWYRTAHAPNPPYRRLWSFRGKKVLEFPPVIDRTGLYLLDNGATLRKINKVTGKQIWKHRLGALSAASPAVVGDGRVYAVTLLSAPGSGHGNVSALDASTGRKIWSRNLPSRAESSPLVHGNMLLFGSEDGTVYSLDKRSGRTIWTYSASGAVKAALALSNGRLYFGDYGGSVQAISVRTGKQAWSSSQSGTFYSTAAVAWGRVFLGSTDGRMYSFTTGGDLAWARQTGNYVYASPAVADVPGLGPTVYGGSYDGTFYAWNARNGASRWTWDAGGKISGGSVVIGNLVWFSDLGNKRVVALNSRTGRFVFKIGTGAFNPAVTDGSTMYLVGYGDLFAFKPKATQR